MAAWTTFAAAWSAWTPARTLILHGPLKLLVLFVVEDALHLLEQVRPRLFHDFTHLFVVRLENLLRLGHLLVGELEFAESPVEAFASARSTWRRPLASARSARRRAFASARSTRWRTIAFTRRSAAWSASAAPGERDG